MLIPLCYFFLYVYLVIVASPLYPRHSSPSWQMLQSLVAQVGTVDTACIWDFRRYSQIQSQRLRVKVSYNIIIIILWVTTHTALFNPKKNLPQKNDLPLSGE